MFIIETRRLSIEKDHGYWRIGRFSMYVERCDYKVPGWKLIEVHGPGSNFIPAGHLEWMVFGFNRRFILSAQAVNQWGAVVPCRKNKAPIDYVAMFRENQARADEGKKDRDAA